MMALINELRANFRLRIGLALIIGIVGAYGLLEWRDLVQARVSEYRQLSNQAARLGDQQSQALWPERAKQARQALDAAEKHLWQNTSFGLAQAELQDWLYARLRRADAKNFTVKLTDTQVELAGAGTAGGTESAAELADVKPLRARIEFNTDPPVLLALLAELNDAEHQVVVDTLKVKGPQVQIELSVWYRLTPSASAPAPALPRS